MSMLPSTFNIVCFLEHLLFCFVLSVVRYLLTLTCLVQRNAAKRKLSIRLVLYSNYQYTMVSTV